MSYFSRIGSTGAITRTPRRIMNRMLDKIGKTDKLKILELGAGRGEITGELYKHLEGRFSEFKAIEINPAFSADLQKKFPGIDVITDNAIHFTHSLTAKMDVIVSSIPFSFLQKDEQDTLIQLMAEHLEDNGRILILFHARWLGKKFRKHLPGAKIEFFLHFPPYYLLTYTKQPA